MKASKSPHPKKPAKVVNRRERPAGLPGAARKAGGAGKRPLAAKSTGGSKVAPPKKASIHFSTKSSARPAGRSSGKPSAKPEPGKAKAPASKPSAGNGKANSGRHSSGKRAGAAPARGVKPAAPSRSPKKGANGKPAAPAKTQASGNRTSRPAAPPKPSTAKGPAPAKPARDTKPPKPAAPAASAKPASGGRKAAGRPNGEAFSTKTPRQLHFRMPAEWEPHFGTWMTWPNRKGISFPGKGAFEAVLPTLLSMIRALLTSEEVFVNVSSEEDKQIIRDSLTIAEQRHLHLVEIPAMEPWCRDHGCTFLVRNEDRAGGSVVWKFNAWGGKYDKALADREISLKMGHYIGGRLFNPGLVLEGGAIDVNGTGTVLTTESCLLNKNRNRGHKREEVEKTLRDFLGVTNILWLSAGVEGDDTDGHIDDITRFVSRDTVVTMVEDNPRDKNHAILEKNLERLRSMKIEDGSPLQVMTVPMPEPITRRGQRLPASYANFYVGNRIVLLPTFDDGADEKALEVMVRSFPTRRIYPIDCRDLIWGLGAFHCLTQQLPLAAFPKVIDLVQNPPPAPRPVY